jgi:hypothetical protein
MLKKNAMKALLLIASLACINAFGQSNDSAAIAQLIINDYKTFNNWNYNKHIANCQPHYSLIENGKIMTLQDEVEYFKKNAHRNIKRTDNFNFFSIRIKGDIGYAIYKLDSTIEEDGKPKFYKWAESAVCERVKNSWKLALIHSTPIK